MVSKRAVERAKRILLSMVAQGLSVMEARSRLTVIERRVAGLGARERKPAKVAKMVRQVTGLGNEKDIVRVLAHVGVEVNKRATR